MESYKKKIDDKEGIFNHIIQNAFGNPIILKSEPTEPAHLKANTAGLYGDDYFIRFANGKLYKFTGTQVT